MLSLFCSYSFFDKYIDDSDDIFCLIQFLIFSKDETRDSKSIILISINGKNLIVIYSHRTRLAVYLMKIFFKNTTDCLLIYYLEVGVSYLLKI